MTRRIGIFSLFLACVAALPLMYGCGARDVPKPFPPPPPMLDVEVWINYNSFEYVRSLLVDGDGLWITSLNGAVKLNAQTEEHARYTTAHGLASNWVAGATSDGKGGVWFSTYAGASKFDGASWTTYNTANSGLAANQVMGAAVDNKGTVWFTTSNGVSWFDGNQWESHDFNTWYGPVIFDKQSTMWIGSNVGMVTKDVNNTWSSQTGLFGMSVGFVWAIAIDKRDTKWGGTSKGVLKFDGTQWIEYDVSNSGLASNQVLSAAVDADGAIWFGTSAGVSKFDGTSWKTYDKATSELPDDFVRAVAIDGKGNKWFGTRVGVTKFNGVSWKTFTLKDLGLVP